MSATWGLAAIPFGYIIAIFFGKFGLLLLIGLLFCFAVNAIEKYQRYSDQHDDPAIVADEVIGMWIAGFFAGSNLIQWVLAFFLFRVFDIIKPWPASYFDIQQSGTLNVILDDIIAALYTLAALALLLLLLPV